MGHGFPLEKVREVVAEVGGPGFRLDDEFSGTEPDPDIPQAFAFSLTDDAFTHAERDAVARHDVVAFVLGPVTAPAAAVEASRRALALAGALLRAGAAAVKEESSARAHGRDRWLALADRAGRAPSGGPEQLAALREAFVKRPISDGGHLFTCGMHLLGGPDVEVDVDLVARAAPDGLDALLDGVARRLLDVRAGREGPVEGETFRLGPRGSRWTLHHRRCPDDGDRCRGPHDPFHNPYGFWRLVPD